MNLFWKKLFGGIDSTAKVEEKHKRLIEEYNRYNSIKGSKEIEEYKVLFEQVKSSDFKENKKTLTSRKYNDTQWYRDATKFEKLSKDASLKSYYEVLESAELEKFLRFKNSNEYILLGKPEEVQKNAELTAYKKYEQSSDYKLYTRFHNSYKTKEYEELKAKVSSEEFKKENDFWKNEKRWETTEAHQIERRYFELCENSDIKFYNSIHPSKFEGFQKYTIGFQDGFKWNSIDASKWNVGFYKNNSELKSIYSFVNELQANNKGNNISVSNGTLQIHTKEEKTKACAWHPEKGFIEKEFAYTSDVIHARNAVCQTGGIFRAKMRFTGSNDVNHAFWLAGDEQTPHINICKFNGKEVEVGIHWQSKYENKYSSQKIKGLNFNDFFIYTLEWNNKELIWYINDYEVFRTNDFVPSKNMIPMFSSFISDKKKGGTGTLEVDYMEVFCEATGESVDTTK